MAASPHNQHKTARIMTKIYTRTGDAGETGLFGGGRVRKDDPRVATCGAVDELNAALGVARAEVARMEPVSEAVDGFLAAVQHELFNLGAELATPEAGRHGLELVQNVDIARLEAAIDHWETELAPLQQFILPGGCAAAAQVHFARCVCRRAEREMVALAAVVPLRGEALRYINRLSDALFVLARTVNRIAGEPDVAWRRES
jgi:cob(I)alamin adenosyltransferase